MKYIKINQKGKAHKNGKCEDAFFISADETVFCLADGVSNSRYGAAGANHIVNACGKAFLSPDFKDLLKNESVEVVRNSVCNIIDNALTKLCKKANERDKEAFASTFLAFIKTDENDVTLIHAGDGAIFGKPKTDQMYFATVLSYPDNTPDGKVYSAGHPEQRNRMRVIRIKPDDYDSIMLCTDGFSEAYLVPSFQAYNIDAITEAFKVRSEAELAELVHREHICERDISDDISCILCVMDDSVPVLFDKRNHTVPAINDEGDTPDISHKYETPSNNKLIAVNQIEYNSPHAKPKKSKKPKRLKSFGVVMSLIAILIFVFSVAMCVHIKESNKVNQNQNTEISLLHEQVGCMERELNEVENALREKDADTSGTTAAKDNKQATLNEPTSRN